MDDKALAAIASALYALPFDEFVTARTAAARAATGSGKELPAAVRALPKPSVAAWAVNMLAVHEPGVLAELAGLGLRMREAQASLDAAALRDLGRERRALLGAAVETAGSVASGHGRSISSTVAAGVEETLRAVTVDESAAAAVQSGLLVRTLSADGVDTVDLQGAVAVPGAVPVPRTIQGSGDVLPRHVRPHQEPRTTAKVGARNPAEPRLKAVRETPRPVTAAPALERANAALADAMEAEQESARLAAQRDRKLEDAKAEVTDLTGEARDLRERLKTVEEKLEAARKQLGTMAAEAKQALRAADKARRTAMLARERVLRLGNTRG